MLSFRPYPRPLAALFAGALGVLAPQDVAAFPGAVGPSLSGATSPTALALSDSERLVAVAQQGGDGLAVFDAYAWSAGAQSLSGLCQPAYDVEFVSGSTVADRFYLACADGTVQYVEVDETTVPVGLSAGATLTLNGGTGTVDALAFAEADLVVHAAVSANGATVLERFTVADDIVDITALPLAVGGAAKDLGISSDGSLLVLPRTDGYVGWVTRSSDSYSNTTVYVGVNLAMDRAAVSSSSGVALVTATADAAVYAIPTNSTTAAAFGESWSSPGPVVFATVDSAEYAIVGDGDLVRFLDLDGAELSSVSLDGVTAKDLAVEESTDVVYVLGSDASVYVLTDGPSLSELSVDPASVGAGETFVVSFVSSADAAWALRLSNSAEPLTGEVLDSGTATAGEAVVSTLSSDSLSKEGDNRLFVVLDQGLAVDSVVVDLDTPPGAISGLSVGAGEGRIVLEWTSSGESDVDSAEVFLSDASFSEGDEVLPSFVDAAGTEYPTTYDVTAGATEHRLSVEDLTNGITYYASVRSVDEGGQVGPLSSVVSAQPDETCGAAECAGDTGGCQCAAISAVEPRLEAGGLGLCAGLCLLLGLRRRSSGTR